MPGAKLVCFSISVLQMSNDKMAEIQINLLLKTKRNIELDSFMHFTFDFLKNHLILRNGLFLVCQTVGRLCRMLSHRPLGLLVS